MFEKLGAFWNLFRRGQEVSDPALWKAKQVTGNMMGAVILALVAVAKGFGYELPMDNETALLIGGGFVAIGNVVLTIITSKRAGLPLKEPQPFSESNNPFPPLMQDAQNVQPAVRPVDAALIAEALEALRKDRNR